MFDLDWGLNSKQPDFLSPKPLEEPVVAEYELEPREPCSV